MPSLARLWNVKFKETKLYSTLESLFKSVRGTQSSLRSTRKYAPSSDSVSHLQKDTHYVEINNGSTRASDEESHLKSDPGIYRLTTVKVTSDPAPKR